jgi:hypothetical protein
MSIGAFFAGLNIEISAETVEALPAPGADADGMAVSGSADPRPANCCGFLMAPDGWIAVCCCEASLFTCCKSMQERQNADDTVNGNARPSLVWCPVRSAHHSRNKAGLVI